MVCLCRVLPWFWVGVSCHDWGRQGRIEKDNVPALIPFGFGLVLALGPVRGCILFLLHYCLLHGGKPDVL